MVRIRLPPAESPLQTHATPTMCQSAPDCRKLAGEDHHSAACTKTVQSVWFAGDPPTRPKWQGTCAVQIGGYLNHSKHRLEHRGEIARRTCKTSAVAVCCSSASCVSSMTPVFYFQPAAPSHLPTAPAEARTGSDDALAGWG